MIPSDAMGEGIGFVPEMGKCLEKYPVEVKPELEVSHQPEPLRPEVLILQELEEAKEIFARGNGYSGGWTDMRERCPENVLRFWVLEGESTEVEKVAKEIGLSRTETLKLVIETINHRRENLVFDYKAIREVHTIDREKQRLQKELDQLQRPR